MVRRIRRRVRDYDGWTLTQRIRTVAQVPVEVALIEATEAPVYQQTAAKALHLRKVGLTDVAIADALGVTDKTASRSIEWPSVPPVLRGRLRLGA